MNRENQVFVEKHYYQDQIQLNDIVQFAMENNIPENEVTVEFNEYDEYDEEDSYIFSGYRPMTQQEIDERELTNRLAESAKQKLLDEENEIRKEIAVLYKDFYTDLEAKKLKEELDAFAALSKGIEDSLADPEQKKKERDEFELYKRLRMKYLFVQDCKDQEQHNT